MSRRLRALALFCALALTLSACNLDLESEEPWENDFPPAEQPSAAKEPEALRISDFTLPYLAAQTLDPVTCPDGVQQVVGALLYEPLFLLNDNFEPEAVLCETCEYDPDKLLYTLTLHAGISFSDGSPLTARDVLAVYRRASASARYGARFRDVASMRVSGELTLLITLRRANAAFPALLDIPIVKSGTESHLVPLGTGPYLFVSDASGAALLENAAWWRQKARPIERIALFSAKDNETAAHLFSSYDVHLLRVDPAGTAAIPTVGEFDFIDYPTSTLFYLGCNAGQLPLSSSMLRTALHAAIDRDALVSACLAGHGLPAALPISPRSALCPTELFTPLTHGDYAAALASLGIDAEHPVTLTLLVNEENSFKNNLADELCAQLSVGGLTVEKRTLPWTAFLAAVQEGDFDLYFGEVRLSADWDFGALISAEGALRYGVEDDATMETLLADFLARRDDDSAARLCRYFLQRAPFLPIAFKAGSLLLPSGLAEGLAPSPSTPFFAFSDWRFHLG